MISYISHMTFIVEDLNKATTFFIKIFDAIEVYSSDEKIFSLSKEKFFLIEGLWICIMEEEPLAVKTYNHIAFKIDEENFNIHLNRIKEFKLEIKSGRPRIKEEASSIYFYDFNNHLFELHTGTFEGKIRNI